MSVLRIEALEKQNEDTVIFPAFGLEMSEGQAVALYSNTNIRNILLRMLNGDMKGSSGDIHVLNKPISTFAKPDYTCIGISYLDDGLYPRLTVKDVFTFYRGLYNSSRTIREVLHALQLETKHKVRVQHLSYSEQRRVQAGRLLFQNPALFVFEEADQNVDMETKRIFIKLIQELKQAGKTILLLTSNMESAITMADHVYRLDETGCHSIEMEQEDESEAQEIEASVEEIKPVVQFDKIPTKIDDKIILFDPTEIDFVETSAGQVLIHIKGEGFPGVFTLTELETRLQPFGFFRCHRSYIVNLQKVREVITWTRNSYTLILEDDKKTEIPLSKTKMAELKAMIGMK